MLMVATNAKPATTGILDDAERCGGTTLWQRLHSWKLQQGWEANLDTPGVIQLGYMRNLFVSRKWHDLVPDQTHAVVIAGYDRFSCNVGKFMAHIGKDRDSRYQRHSVISQSFRA